MAYVAGVCFCGFWVLLELFVLLCWLFVVGGCWAVLVWLLAGVVFLRCGWCMILARFWVCVSVRLGIGVAV